MVLRRASDREAKWSPDRGWFPSCSPAERWRLRKCTHPIPCNASPQSIVSSKYQILFWHRLNLTSLSVCKLQCTLYCIVPVLSTLGHQEIGEQTERGEDSQTGGTQSAGERGDPPGSSIAQPTKEVATPLSSASRGGGGDRPSSPGVKEQARMSPLPKEQARVTFCTTPTSPTANSSSKPPLQVPVTVTINLIHGEIVQGAARAVPILRNSESSSNGGPRMRNKSESSRLGEQEDLKRLTAELEVRPFIKTMSNSPHGPREQTMEIRIFKPF